MQTKYALFKIPKNIEICILLTVRKDLFPMRLSGDVVSPHLQTKLLSTR